MRTTILARTLIGLAIGSLGCQYPTDVSSLDALPDDLDVTLAVDPPEVTNGESFLVTLSVANRGPSPITIRTGSTCLATPSVYHRETFAPFEGTSIACGLAMTNHVIQPGQTLAVSWTLTATFYGVRAGDPRSAPVGPGRYEVRAVFDTRDKPYATHPLTVR